MNKKIAYILAGGGAKGAFQVGVLKLLHKKGIVPDVIYGTSIGSVNAATYAYAGPDKLEELWLNIKSFKDLASFNWLSIIGRNNGLYNLNPTRKKLKNLVENNNPTCEVVVTKIELNSGDLIYGRSTEEDFIDSVIASGSIPIVFSSVNGFVDGALREKAPLKIAIDEGADEIHVILTSSAIDYGKKHTEADAAKNILTVAFRSLEIMNHEIFINDIKRCLECNKLGNKKYIDLRVYAPPETILDTLEFDKDKIKKAIQQGTNVVNQTKWLK